MKHDHRPAAISPFPPYLAEDDDGPVVPDFLPWFPQRRTANGWTPERQRAFLDRLGRTGSVRLAAGAVGKSARSAQQLRNKPGAEHFAVIWDQMVEDGVGRVRDANFERAMHGELVPVFRRGRYQGIRLKYPDRLAVAILQSAKGLHRQNDIADERERLRKWEIAISKRELDLPGGDDHRAKLLAAEDHALWMKALANEERLKKAAEYRATLRKARLRAQAEPRARFL